MVFGSTKLKNECAFNSDNKAALIFPAAAIAPFLSYASGAKYFLVYASIKVLPVPVSVENT